MWLQDPSHVSRIRVMSLGRLWSSHTPAVCGSTSVLNIYSIISIIYKSVDHGKMVYMEMKESLLTCMFLIEVSFCL